MTQVIQQRPSKIGTAKKRRPAEKKICSICGKTVEARGYKNHIRLAHQLTLKPAAESMKMHPVTQVKKSGGQIDLSKPVGKVYPVQVFETRSLETGEICVTWSFQSPEDRAQYIRQESWMAPIESLFAFSENDGLYNFTHCRVPANHRPGPNRIPSWALEPLLKFH